MKPQGKKRRFWLLVLLFAIALLLLAQPLIRPSGRTQWAIVFDSADAGFYRLTWEEPATNRFGPKYVSTARVRFGLKICSRTEVPNPITEEK